MALRSDANRRSVRFATLFFVAAGLIVASLVAVATTARAERMNELDGGFPGFVIDRSRDVPPRLPRNPAARSQASDIEPAKRFLLAPYPGTAVGYATAPALFGPAGSETDGLNPTRPADALPYGLPDPSGDTAIPGAGPDAAGTGVGAPEGARIGNLETTGIAPDMAFPSAFGAPGLFEPGSFAPPTTGPVRRAERQGSGVGLTVRQERPALGSGWQTLSQGNGTGLGTTLGTTLGTGRQNAEGATNPQTRPYVTAAGALPAVQASPIDRSVESGELEPIMSSDGSGLPGQLWLGLDMAEFDRLLANLEIPPRSTALFDLWRRLMSSEGSEPAGTASQDHFLAVRLEGLTRAGLFDVALRIGEAAGAQTHAPMIQVLLARAALGAGKTDQACEMLRPLGLGQPDLPERLLGEVWASLAYCAARQGSANDAGLVADMARDRGVKAPEMFKLIDALAAGDELGIEAGSQIGLITWKLLSLDLAKAGAVSLGQLSAAALAATALDPAAPVPIRLAAAERAARQHLLAPSVLAEIYAASPIEVADPASALQIAAVDAQGRAALFKTIAATADPAIRARLIAKMLQDVRGEDLGQVIAAAFSGFIEAMRPGSGFDWFAETAIEVNLAAGRYEPATAWAVFSGSTASAKPYAATNGAATRLGTGAGNQRDAAPISLLHWLNLIDIAAARDLLPRGANLAHLQDLALSGAFEPDTLHRLVTVLDALGYQIPIPLWEIASRTDQPTSGYLPETGILSELKAAAGERAHGRVILLAMATLGPDGARGANLIALGDAIRALSASGLEAEARQLAFEALFASWPRLRAD